MINTCKIEMVCVWIYVFLVFISSDKRTLMIASLFLLLGFVLSSLKRGKILLRWNAYYTVQLVFLAYCLFQIVFGLAIIENVSLSMSKLLMINCIDEILLFNILSKQENTEDILNSLIYPFAVGLVVLFIIQFRSGMLLTSRFSSSFEEDITYKIMGIRISAGSATIVGHCAVCAFTFSLINYYSSRKKKYVVLTLICLIALILTVSRKSYAAALGIFIIVPELFVHNSRRLKKICGVFLILVIAVAVMNIPVIYELIGKRFVSLFLDLRGVSNDHSLSLREQFRTMAWAAFLERPIIGWGVDSFKYYFNNGWFYSHCNYLELLVGTGLIGTSIFLFKYLILLKSGLTITASVKKGNSKIKSILQSLLTWLIVVWVIEYWQVAYYNERVIVHYTIVLATFMSIERQVESDKTLQMIILSVLPKLIWRDGNEDY